MVGGGKRMMVCISPIADENSLLLDGWAVNAKKNHLSVVGSNH